ncbi:hypothetical protein BDV93DRAFT_606257 [Ceratobasidium sp. AG-I]|nr:hypothetical protein BDV93DRAFT_606257 [Ceratobasidium sp. AG-I]
MFGLGAAVRGYAQMIFGPEIANAGIKRTQFKPMYIPAWVVDSAVSFTSQLGDSDHPTTMHLRDATVPGLHHHPLSRWVKSFPDDIDLAKPFSGEYLEPLNGKHEILSLPYTTSPLTIPQALSELPLGNVEISTGWSIDPRSVEVKMLAAYPLLHPVFLAEYVMEDKHITVLAHGHHDYFSVWGHPSHPDEWVNSEHGVMVSYLRSSQSIMGSPVAMVDFLSSHTTPNNLERITRRLDMTDLRIQPISSADSTRHWMTLAAKVDEIKFIVENIPTSASANLIRIQVGPGLKARKSRIEGSAIRTPLEHQLEEMEAEMEDAKPEWLVKWDELGSDGQSEHTEKPVVK